MLQKNRAQFVFTRFPFKTQSVVAPIQLGNLLMRLIVLNILPLFGRNSRVIHSHCFPSSTPKLFSCRLKSLCIYDFIIGFVSVLLLLIKSLENCHWFSWIFSVNWPRFGYKYIPKPSALLLRLFSVQKKYYLLSWF